MNEDTIAVAIRLRPFEEKGAKKPPEHAWAVSGNEVFLNEREIFTFDYVFDTNATNHDLHTVVMPLVHSALDGMNALIFAYGQTSSGKTHSITGTRNDPGIIPQSVSEIFNTISSREERTYVLRMSYLEIYNEKVNDLLDTKNRDLKIREDAGGVFVKTKEVIVRNEREMLDIIESGNRHAKIGDTRMNEKSSRSHVICDIVIESYKLDECVEGKMDAETPVQASHFYIVDLAGSERVSQTGATGSRLNEGMHINKSLSVLISVINQRSAGQSYVSYRDSKLTRLLSNALGGNSKTLILATIKPASIDDSLSTLKFARSAKMIKTAPRINEIVNEKSMIKRLQSREKELLTELDDQKLHNYRKDNTIKKLEAELIDIRSSFVLKGITKSRKVPRRHTMAALPNGQCLLEPIMEDVTPNGTATTSTSTTQPTPTMETDIDVTKNYCDLRRQYDDLEESYISLKTFTRIEMEVEISERTQEYCIQIERLQAQLQRSQEGLFTTRDLEVAVEKRVVDLQQKVQQLEEQNAINEAEADVIQKQKQRQHECRERELLARIEELQTGARITPTGTACRPVSRRTSYQLDPPTPVKQLHRLTRSISDPHLFAQQRGDGDASKGDFKEIYKSLRALTTTIITNDALTKTDVSTETENHLVNGNVQDEALTIANEENAVLMEKLKRLTDKFNNRGHGDVGMQHSTVCDLQARIAVLEERLERSREMCENCKTARQQVKDFASEQLTLLSEALRAKDDELRHKGSVLKAKEAQVAELEHKMQEIEALLEDSQQKIADAHREQLMQKARHKDLQKQLQDRNGELSASQDEARSFKDKCSKLNEELKESKHVSKLAQRTMDCQVMELDEALARIDGLERRNKDLEKALQDRTGELSALQDRTGELSALQDEVRSLKASCSKLDEALTQSSHVLKLTQNTMDCQVKEMGYARARIDDLEHRNQELEALLTSDNTYKLKASITTLQKALKASNESLDDLKQQHAQLKIDFDDRAQQLQQQQVAESKLKKALDEAQRNDNTEELKKLKKELQTQHAEVVRLQASEAESRTNELTLLNELQEYRNYKHQVKELREELQELQNAQSLRSTEIELKKLKYLHGRLVKTEEKHREHAEALTAKVASLTATIEQHETKHQENLLKMSKQEDEITRLNGLVCSLQNAAERDKQLAAEELKALRAKFEAKEADSKLHIAELRAKHHQREEAMESQRQQVNAELENSKKEREELRGALKKREEKLLAGLNALKQIEEECQKLRRIVKQREEELSAVRARCQEAPDVEIVSDTNRQDYDKIKIEYEQLQKKYAQLKRLISVSCNHTENVSQLQSLRKQLDCQLANREVYLKKKNALEATITELRAEIRRLEGVIRPPPLTEEQRERKWLQQQRNNEIDDELCAIPEKLAIIIKLASWPQTEKSCTTCSSTNRTLKTLYEACRAHAFWHLFDVVGSERLMRTDQFDLLVATRNRYQAALASEQLETEAREALYSGLQQCESSLKEFEREQSQKLQCLQFVSEQLRRTMREFSNVENSSTSCADCAQYEACRGLVDALYECVANTVWIVDAVRDGLPRLELNLKRRHHFNERVTQFLSQLESTTKEDLERLKQRYADLKKVTICRQKNCDILGNALMAENYVLDFKKVPVSVRKDPRYAKALPLKTQAENMPPAHDFDKEANPRPATISKRHEPNGNRRLSFGSTPPRYSFLPVPDDNRKVKK